ncbi:hypothetical protein BGZ63DRAFT_455120 [Mariannaea sp. PMI_226]|nr:hypothetical protein BGZ63DRAFT_455120 [Mariannaea sp. PMI_226]
MLLKFVSTITLFTSALGAPIFARDAEAAQRENEKWIQLPDGNGCDLLASVSSGTELWQPIDYSNLFDIAGNALTSSISQYQQVEVGTIISFQDHTGSTYQVDCEVTVTGAAPVSVEGAYQNVDQAMRAAKDLADHSWTGFIDVTKNTLGVYFGDVPAINIVVNVLK